MNSLQLHMDAVHRDPFDKAAALALIDHIQEELGDSYRAAVVLVAQKRVYARRLITRTKADMYLNAHHKLSALLYNLIRAAAGDPGEELPVYVVEGFSAPHVRHQGVAFHGLFGNASSTICVGARWLLAVQRCVNTWQSLRFEAAKMRLPSPASPTVFGYLVASLMI